MDFLFDGLVTLLALAGIIYSIVLHEVAHGYVAFRLGDPTAAMLGRLTLNPVSHIDPFRTIALPLILYFATNGAFVFGGAKPVPVNPYNFRSRHKGMMLTGIAGPAANLLIMLTCVAILRFPYLSNTLVRLFFKIGLWNMLLMVFNMVPIPPLDGSRVLSYFLPRELAMQYEKLEQFGLLIVMLVVFSRVLDPVFLFAFERFVLLAGRFPL